MKTKQQRNEEIDLAPGTLAATMPRPPKEAAKDKAKVKTKATVTAATATMVTAATATTAPATSGALGQTIEQSWATVKNLLRAATDVSWNLGDELNRLDVLLARAGKDHSVRGLSAKCGISKSYVADLMATGTFFPLARRVKGFGWFTHDLLRRGLLSTRKKIGAAKVDSSVATSIAKIDHQKLLTEIVAVNPHQWPTVRYCAG